MRGRVWVYVALTLPDTSFSRISPRLARFWFLQYSAINAFGILIQLSQNPVRSRLRRLTGFIDVLC